MPIYETFKKRNERAENAGKPVIYRDDVLPPPFRVQVAHIWGNTIGYEDGWFAVGVLDFDRLWAVMNKTLATEMGLFTLWDGERTSRNCCERFLLNAPGIDDVLSLIEISFRTPNRKRSGVGSR